MTYEEFCSIVPKDTVTFVKDLLPYCSYFLTSSKEKSLSVRNSDTYSERYETKSFILMLYSLDNIQIYDSFLGKIGFSSKNVNISKEIEDKIKSKSINEKTVFEQYSDLFLIYSDRTLYSTLTPLELIHKRAIKYDINVKSKNFFEEVTKKCDFAKFLPMIEREIAKEQFEYEQKIEMEIFKDFPISVISYLETASKIRTILYENQERIIKYDCMEPTEDNIVAVSLLLAIYYYQDENLITANKTEKEVLKKVLEERNITIDKLNKVLITINSSDFNNIKRNLYALFLNYGKYLEHDPNSEVTVTSILSKVFDRNISNTIVIEKILTKASSNISELKNLKQLVQKQKEDEQKTFYKDLPRNTNEFINFTGKIYTLILQKMNEGQVNKAILSCEDDADTLALYIAAHYYKKDIDEFFRDHGVTYEKILNLLNLNITREEIDKISIDDKVLMERFGRFVFQGVNKNKNHKSIEINDILNNLYDREFNRSMIMENIFNSLCSELELEMNFYKQLSTYLENKKELQKRKLSQRLFQDMPIETIKYLENVSKIHTILVKQNPTIILKDIQSFALLMGIFISTSEYNKFFEKMNFSFSNLKGFINCDDSYSKVEIDVDVLANQYNKFIFGGCNKDAKREDISILSIIKNVLSKELNNSVLLNKYLNFINHTYDDFSDLDKLYDEYFIESEKENEEDKRKEITQKLLNHYSESSYDYVTSSFKIYKRIKANLIENTILDTDEKIVQLSLILGLCKNKDTATIPILDKYGLNLNVLLISCYLNESVIMALFNEDIFIDIEIVDIYKKYLDTNSHWYNDEEVFKNTLVKVLKEENILEAIFAKTGQNYDAFKYEIITGKEYEYTVDERIKTLQSYEVEQIDVDDIKSIISFGNQLTPHSTYIHSELPKQILNDTTAESTKTIYELMDKVHTIENQKSKNPLMRLFGSTKNPEVIINHDAVSILRTTIEDNINSLSNELVVYDKIRKYMAVYESKNREHLAIAEKMVKQLEEKLSGLNPNNPDQYADYLMVNSYLQAMKEKQNRFMTTHHFMQQELFKINQVIVNHFITIDALGMARDDLLPIIGSELLISIGNTTVNNSLELSKTMIDLFGFILDKNIEGTMSVMEKIKSLSPTDVYDKINLDISRYLTELSEGNQFVMPIEEDNLGQQKIKENN